MTTRIAETLETKIERLVHEHLVAQQLAARGAVERAFSVAAPAAKRAAPRLPLKYRSRAEVAQLAERVFEAVRSRPGETMTVIAAHVGEAARLLKQPMMRLKEAGRVRSAGEHSFKRYFPMTSA